MDPQDDGAEAAFSGLADVFASATTSAPSAPDAPPAPATRSLDHVFTTVASAHPVIAPSEDALTPFPYWDYTARYFNMWEEKHPDEDLPVLRTFDAGWSVLRGNQDVRTNGTHHRLVIKQGAVEHIYIDASRFDHDCRTLWESRARVRIVSAYRLAPKSCSEHLPDVVNKNEQ